MVIKELKKILEDFGVSEGDTLCVFSDITSFGIPEALKEEVKEHGIVVIMDAYIDSFKNVVGKQGMLVMPTFTYSATEKKDYDVQYSESVVGVLTEHFRKQKDVYRSRHPIFSFAAWGSGAESFVKLSGFDSLGKQSLLGKMYDKNAIYLLFGITMPLSATFVLYSEQKNKVHYRHMKDFPATIIDGKEQLKVVASYFVRDLDLDYQYGWGDLEREGRDRGIIKASKFNNGSVLSMRAKKIDELIHEKLLEDRNFLVKKSEL